ncbi:RNA-directed DNA polymerase [Hibiscus syriacus]|uniref:RNA-directed DNA polymerase n=1 Tax=Hibiscus syriacus TaxID=106335 RepID=A0A6A3CUW7_HIBSY|nr:uncharacterized protein LOC120155576 [Hibiscus syriacus]KAE8731222.1 RNA-directed DNA polymerase [Hibiscus syriacus]
MEDMFQTITWGLNEPRHSQKRPTESYSEDGEEDCKSASTSLQEWDHIFSQMYPPNWVRGQNQPAISSGVVPSQISNVSSPQTFQSPDISTGSVLKRNVSSLHGSERAQRKRKIDQAYRARCKNLKMEMQLNMENLKGENDSLMKENESLKDANSLMNQTLKDQEKEIEQLKSDLLQIKCEYEKQNVLVQTLSGLLADPMSLENKKLKDENASLRKNANLNNNLPQLAEENAKLRTENKVLKVQNDALCGKIISDHEKKCKQDQ